MGDRRMLSRKITDNDNFIELSAEQQALYMHLVMSADDYGACDKISMALFKAHANKADLKALIDAHYLIQMASGIVVIKHWMMANVFRKDRAHPSAYQDEIATLYIKKNGSYTTDVNQLAADCHQLDTNLTPNGGKLTPNGGLTKPNLTKPNLTKPNLTKPNLTKRNKTAKAEDTLAVLNSLHEQYEEEEAYEQSGNF